MDVFMLSPQGELYLKCIIFISLAVNSRTIDPAHSVNLTATELQGSASMFAPEVSKKRWD